MIKYLISFVYSSPTGALIDMELDDGEYVELACKGKAEWQGWLLLRKR